VACDVKRLHLIVNKGSGCKTIRFLKRSVLLSSLNKKLSVTAGKFFMLILPVLYEKERESKRGTRRRPIVLSTSKDVGLAYLVCVFSALPKQTNTHPLPTNFS
jgi:hypothetical protein